MNYMIIQNTENPDTVREPFPIVQMFTNDNLMDLAKFVQYMVDNHGDLDNDPGCRAAHTFLHLLGQWEDRTQ